MVFMIMSLTGKNTESADGNMFSAIRWVWPRKVAENTKICKSSLWEKRRMRNTDEAAQESTSNSLSASFSLLKTVLI